MKRLITALLLIVCGVFCMQTMYANDIVTKGQWGQEDIRSIFPAPPQPLLKEQT